LIGAECGALQLLIIIGFVEQGLTERNFRRKRVQGKVGCSARLSRSAEGGIYTGVVPCGASWLNTSQDLIHGEGKQAGQTMSHELPGKSSSEGSTLPQPQPLHSHIYLID
jgi:hypothetical protein